jgi:hypothetical protein
MRLTTLFTITAAIAACLIGARCSPQTVTQERAPVQVVHVDGDTIEILANLTDPAKIDTLTGKRAATPRLRKTCYWLHTTPNPAEAIKRAQIKNGSHGTARAQETASALLRNLTILERLGCLDDAGLDKLRRGNAPTITKGPYAGELATVDHIIPRSVIPELDNKLFNLEFMPDTLNQRKDAKIGDRQRQLARKWNDAGLLSDEGLKAVDPPGPSAQDVHRKA